MAILTCAVCAWTFESRNYHALYCSDLCRRRRMAERREKHRSSPQYMRDQAERRAYRERLARERERERERKREARAAAKAAKAVRVPRPTYDPGPLREFIAERDKPRVCAICHSPFVSRQHRQTLCDTCKVSAQSDARVARGTHLPRVQLEQRMMVTWGGRCWVCRKSTATARDHVKPLAKGGPHILANLRPICTSCNSRKSDHWPFTRDHAWWL